MYLYSTPAPINQMVIEDSLLDLSYFFPVMINYTVNYIYINEVSTDLQRVLLLSKQNFEGISIDGNIRVGLNLAQQFYSLKVTDGINLKSFLQAYEMAKAKLWLEVKSRFIGHLLSEYVECVSNVAQNIEYFRILEAGQIQFKNDGNDFWQDFKDNYQKVGFGIYDYIELLENKMKNGEEL